MYARYILLADILVVVLSASIRVDANDDRPLHFCGPILTKTMSEICKGHFNLRLASTTFKSKGNALTFFVIIMPQTTNFCLLTCRRQWQFASSKLRVPVLLHVDANRSAWHCLWVLPKSMLEKGARNLLSRWLLAWIQQQIVLVSAVVPKPHPRHVYKNSLHLLPVFTKQAISTDLYFSDHMWN